MVEMVTLFHVHFALIELRQKITFQWISRKTNPTNSVSCQILRYIVDSLWRCTLFVSAWVSIDFGWIVENPKSQKNQNFFHNNGYDKKWAPIYECLHQNRKMNSEIEERKLMNEHISVFNATTSFPGKRKAVSEWFSLYIAIDSTVCERVRLWSGFWCCIQWFLVKQETREKKTFTKRIIYIFCPENSRNAHRLS